MLKRLRAKHPVGFCILAEVLFLGSLILASYCIIAVLLVAAGVTLLLRSRTRAGADADTGSPARTRG